MLHLESRPVATHIAPKTDIETVAHVGSARYHPTLARPAPLRRRKTRSAEPTFLSKERVRRFFRVIFAVFRLPAQPIDAVLQE